MSFGMCASFVLFCPFFAIFAEAKPRLGRTVSRQGRFAALHSACAVLARQALSGGIRFRPFAGSVPFLARNSKPERYEKFIDVCIYDCYRSRTDLVRRGFPKRNPVDRRPFRRHQGHPLRSPRLRAASAGGEGADLLSGRSDQMRPRHPVRPELQVQPRRAPHARNGV